VTPSLHESPVPYTEAVAKVRDSSQENEEWNEQPWDSLHDLKIEDELIDALDEACVPDELLENMQMHEATAMSPYPDSGTALPPFVRSMALEFLSKLAVALELPQSKWFLMVAVLDVYCRRHRGVNTVSRLQATCVALVKILNKVDAAEPAKQVLLAKQFEHTGISAMFTRDILNQQEASLLETLDWKITIPSTESWLSTYCTRFNALSRGLLVSSLVWVWGETVTNASALIRCSPSSAQFSQRKQANGLLGLGFVSAGLLPPSAMATEKLCPVLWQQLLLEINCTKAQQATAPKHLLLGSHARHILKLLCLTVGADLKNLQQDCKDVALFLRSAVPGICGAPSPGMFSMECSAKRPGATMHHSV